MKKKYLVGVFFLFGLTLVSPGTVRAATCTFTGAVDTDWHTAGNWDCASVPGSTDSAVLPAGVSVSGTTALVNPGDLTVGAGAVLDLVGQDLAVASGTTSNAGTIHSDADMTFQAVDNSGVIFSTGFGTVSFLGPVTNSGGIETDTSGTPVEFHSTWDNTGGTLDSGYLLRFLGDADQSIPANISGVYGLSMNKSGNSTLTLQANLETNGGNSGLVLIGAGPATFDLGGFTVTSYGNSLSLFGDNDITNGAVSLIPTFGTVTASFGGVGAVDIDLTIDASGTVTFGAATPGGIFDLRGDLNVLSGTIDIASTDQFYVNGTTTNAGTINNNAVSTLFTGAVANTGTIGSSGSGPVTFMGPLDNQGALALGSAFVDFWSTWDNASGSINPEARVELFGSNNMTFPAGITIAYLNVGKLSSAARVTLSGDVTVNGSVLLQGGVLDLEGNTLSARSITQSSGIMDPDLGTVEIIGAGSSQRITNVDRFYTLVINPDGASDIVYLGGETTIDNSLTVANGRLAFLSSGTNSLTFTRSGTGALRPFRAAAEDFIANGGTVRYENVTAATDIEPVNYAHLTVDGSGNTFDTYASTTVTGTLAVSSGTTLRLLDRLEAAGPISNQGLISVVIGPFIHPTESLAITDASGTDVTELTLGAHALYVTLRDGNRNLDGTVTETVNVSVTADAAAGSDAETLLLTETGPATGEFRNTDGMQVWPQPVVTAGDGYLDLRGSGVLTVAYADDLDPVDTANASIAVSAPGTGSSGGSSGGGGGGGGILPSVTEYQEYTYGSAGYDGTPVGSTTGLLEPHTLVKLPDDGDPLTQADSAVYYIGTEGMRHAFPNAKVYFTWYASFDGIQTVSQEQLASIPLGQNVTYKPGMKLVKFLTDPKVYAVAPGAVLHWVATEELARSLYGADWMKQVDDISDAFYENYAFGDDITDAAQYDPAAMRASAAFPSANFTADDVFGA